MMLVDNSGGVFAYNKRKFEKQKKKRAGAFLATSDLATWVWTLVWNAVTPNWASMSGREQPRIS